MDKHQWMTISSGHYSDEIEVDTCVMEVPGGVMMRYRMVYHYAGRTSVAMTLVPGAKITDFEKEQEKDEEE